MSNKLKALFNKIFIPVKVKTYGKNNIINMHKTVYTKYVSISIYGNNNTIIVEEGADLHKFTIRIGFSNCPVENCVIRIGKNTSFNSALIQVGESNSTVQIGSNCMCSYGIEINCTDQHSIFNKDNELINVGKYVNIGSHVWICKNVTIMKNSNVPDGCILAQRSLIAKHFEKENCVIAGNPAKIVKEDIHWDRIRPQNFLRDNN